MNWAAKRLSLLALAGATALAVCTCLSSSVYAQATGTCPAVNITLACNGEPQGMVSFISSLGFTTENSCSFDCTTSNPTVTQTCAINGGNRLQGEVSDLSRGCGRIISLPATVSCSNVSLTANFTCVFAGTPGKANCHGKTVSALAQQFGGLDQAAITLGYQDVQTLQDAIQVYCGN